MYMERDRLELKEIRRRMPPPLLEYYIQVQMHGCPYCPIYAARWSCCC